MRRFYVFVLRALRRDGSRLLSGSRGETMKKKAMPSHRGVGIDVHVHLSFEQLSAIVSPRQIKKFLDVIGKVVKEAKNVKSE